MRTSPTIEIDDKKAMNPTHKDEKAIQARHRLRGFVLHLLGYVVVMIVLVAINYLSGNKDPWFVLPMVGWGSVLALHVARVMRLFDGLMKR